MATSSIKTYTSTGKALSTSIKPIPGNGAPVTVAPAGAIIRRRLSLDEGITGSSVKITNPQYSGGRINKRTASLGMGGVGQRGRSMDVPNTI